MNDADREFASSFAAAKSNKRPPAAASGTYSILTLRIEQKTPRADAAGRPEVPTDIDKLSDLSSFDGVSYVVHATNFSGLEGILNDRSIKPSDHVKGGGGRTQGEPDVVYLEAIGPKVMGTQFGVPWYEAKWKIKLVFSTDVLDENNFHVSRGWKFGKYLETSSALSSERQKLHEILWDIGHGQQEGNELVFSRPVGLSSLKAIWVEPADRKKVIAALRASHFEPPNGRSIEEFVASQDCWPSSV